MLDRRLLFVTGKGGVGKSSVTAALGLLAAAEGRRVLVADLDARGDVAAAYECPPLGFDPSPVTDNIWAMAMSTEESLKEYLRINLRVPLLTRIGPLARSFDFVAQAAPGVKEILTVGKLAYEVRERHYDLVIADAPATGHVVGQLAAPAAIHELVRVGLVREQTEWMIDLLADPGVSGTVVVTVAEEMPVTETLELTERLSAETEVSVAGVVVNRVLPELFVTREEQVFENLKREPARSALMEAAGDGAAAVLDGAQLATDLRRTRSRHIDRLNASLPPEVPVLYLPELFTRAKGIRMTNMLAEALGDEL